MCQEYPILWGGDVERRCRKGLATRTSKRKWNLYLATIEIETKVKKTLMEDKGPFSWAKTISVNSSRETESEKGSFTVKRGKKAIVNLEK